MVLVVRELGVNEDKVALVPMGIDGAISELEESPIPKPLGAR